MSTDQWIRLGALIERSWQQDIRLARLERRIAQVARDTARMKEKMA